MSAHYKFAKLTAAQENYGYSLLSDASEAASYLESISAVVGGNFLLEKLVWNKENQINELKLLPCTVLEIRGCKAVIVAVNDKRTLLVGANVGRLKKP